MGGAMNYTELDINQLKIIIQENNYKTKNYQIVFKRLNKFYQDFICIKNKSRNKEDFTNITNPIISTEKEKDFSNMLITIQRFLLNNIEKDGTQFLKLMYDGKKYYLRPVTKGVVENTPQKVMTLLRINSSNFPIDYTLINPEAYSKLENFFEFNPDVLYWFDELISNSRNSFKYLGKHIKLMYDNLTQENKDITIQNILKGDPESIIQFVKSLPKTWTFFITPIENYAEKKVKGSKEKIQEYISRDILNNTVSPDSVRDKISRYYKKSRKQKKPISNRYSN
ncbi:MAG TPA: hypothetical protein PKA90_14130 [Ignavibacteria bacterium]|nr:hypothetical protein [Ignavibacteria bacterium]HMR41557.1 hypothetical protein [Ignavibacteria bacterium]